MSSTLVDGLVLPVAVGGHPALDFCNTRAGWGTPAVKEYLLSYEHLAVWACESGLLAASSLTRLLSMTAGQPSSGHRVLSDAVRLREAAYHLALGERSPADLGVVGRHARAARDAMNLHPAPAGRGPVASWVLVDDGVDAPLLAVAAQVDDLLCSALSAVVAACPGRGCGWLFADPRRRRRWCDMAVCGNRAKARRHAERLATARG